MNLVTIMGNDKESLLNKINPDESIEIEGKKTFKA
jgi:hypothetical protein